MTLVCTLKSTLYFITWLNIYEDLGRDLFSTVVFTSISISHQAIIYKNFAKKIDKNDGKSRFNVEKIRENDILREEKDDGKSETSVERLERIERSRPYAVQDGIEITLGDMARAADMDVRRSLAASFASGLVKVFKVSTTKHFLAFVREAAAKHVRSVLNTEGRLMFVKYGHLMCEYIPTICDVDFDSGFIKEPLDYEGRV